MIITLKKLIDAGACREQRALFKRTFPSGRVTVTEERCIKHAVKFNWNWASQHLFTCRQLRSYQRECESARGELLDTPFSSIIGSPAWIARSVALAKYFDCIAREFARVANGKRRKPTRKKEIQS